MDNILTFKNNPTQQTFNTLHPIMKKLLYISSIFSIDRSMGDTLIARKILSFYHRLLLEIGVIGRKELTNSHNRYISYTEKAILKKNEIINIINTYRVEPESVFYFDDNKEIIDAVKAIGVNAVLVKNHLRPEMLLSLISKKVNNTKSVSIVLTDFNYTFLTTTMKKKDWNPSNLNIMIDRFFGGEERIRLLFNGFKQLEQLGIKIGIITFQTSTLTKQVLQDLYFI